MMDTETKTILHYAKKIKEFCKLHKTCKECKISTQYQVGLSTFDKCYFEDIPEQWPEVDLHE